MADQGKRVIVDGVEFQRVCNFPRILSEVTRALQPSRMIIALFMVVLLLAVGRLWDRFTEPNVRPGGLMQGRYLPGPEAAAHEQALAAGVMMFARDHVQGDDPSKWNLKTRQVKSWVMEGHLKQRDAKNTDAERAPIDDAYVAIMQRIEETRPLADFEATVRHVVESFRDTLRGVYHLSAAETINGLDMMLVQTGKALARDQRWFAIVYGLVCLIVCAIGGGAISRMAAMHQARDQRLSLNEGVDFALSRAGALVWAKALPLVLIGILAVVILLVGLLMRVPILDIITALCYGLVLLLGVLMAFLVLGYAIGFPLLVPAVACENCDGADAMQRAYAYVVNRPMHALWYWVVALVGLLIGFTIVTVLALLTLNLSGGLFSQLAGGPPAGAVGGYDFDTLQHDIGRAVAGNWHQRWSVNILLAWEALVICLVVAYVLSYYSSASAIGYLLMRKASDGQETDEIWRQGMVPGTQAPLPSATVQVTEVVVTETS